MSLSKQPVTPYQSSNSKPKKESAVTVKTNASEMKRSGRHGDPLAAGFRGVGKKTLPAGTHKASSRTTPKATGAHYNPRGEFGSAPSSVHGGTSYTFHINVPGSNALGHAMNTVGDNALTKSKFKPRGGGKNV